MLLQDKDLFAGFAHEGTGDQAADAGANNDGVQVVRDILDVKALLDDTVPFLLVDDIFSPNGGVVLLEGVGAPRTEVPADDLPDHQPQTY